MMDKAEIENKMHNLIGIMYETGYSRGLKERKEEDQDYKDGLEDGKILIWQFIGKLGKLTIGESRKIFGDKYDNFYKIAYDYSPSEFIAKIKEYEDKHTDNEIKLWDEVIIKKSDYGYTGHKGVVVQLVDSSTVSVMFDYHNSHWYHIDNLEKTGKSYPELGNILDQLKGDNDQ